MVFARKCDADAGTVFERVFARYKAGNDDYKNMRMKYLVKIPNASWLLRGSVSALGGFRPVVRGFTAKPISLSLSLSRVVFIL